MTTVFELADKVAAYKAKLDLWGRRVDRGVFDMFQTLVEILGESEAGPILLQLVRNHLVALSNDFDRYFPSSKDPQRTNESIRNPFVNVPNHLSVKEEDQLIEIANDGGLKSVFEQTSLAGFWIKTKAEYPKISVKALKTLLPFPTTYR